MARLHEYQGKKILAVNGFKIPRGRAVSSANKAVAAAKELGGEIVIKIQAWTTGRAGIGGVAFAKNTDEVTAHAKRMLSMKVGQFPVEAVLVEEKIDVDREFFLSFAIDDAARAPVIIFAGGGGTGIEERATSTRRIPCDVNRGPLDSAVDEAVVSCGVSAINAKQRSKSIRKMFVAARSVGARWLEINPLVLSKSGELVGYFGSGSGVASQEQFWSAYGLAKAFWELNLDIPAVIRLGGNTEDRAVEILHRMSKLLRAPVVGCRKTDTPAFIATRFAELVASAYGKKWKPRAPRVPKFVSGPSVTQLA